MRLVTPLSRAFMAITSFKSNIPSIAPTDSLNLSGYGLENQDLETLGSDLKSLDLLEHLDLSNNKLTQLPEELGELSNLKSLNLENNELENFIENTEQLVNLEVLLIGQNVLVELPDSIGNLEQLRVIEADRNRLITIPQDVERLKLLKSLVLWGNHIKELPQGIGGMQQLKKLNLGYNQLKNFPKEIGQLQKLVELRADRNLLREIPEHFVSLTKLKSLDLWGNLIEKITPEIENMEKLKKLTLDRNQIYEFPEWLNSMDHLEISLSENPLKTDVENSIDDKGTGSARTFQLKEIKSLFASDTPYFTVLNQAKSKLKDEVIRMTMLSTELAPSILDVHNNLIILAKELNIISKYRDESDQVYQDKLEKHASLFVDEWKNRVNLFLLADHIKKQMILEKLSKPLNIENKTIDSFKKRSENLKNKRFKI